MFGRAKQHHGPPDRSFVHQDGCAIVRADSDFEPVCSEVERRHWRRECQCGAEDTASAGATVFGSTLFDPSTTRESASTGPRPIQLSSRSY